MRPPSWTTGLILLTGCLAILWYFVRPRYRFTIRIDDGRPRLTQGRITDAFLEDIQEVCRDFHIATGWIKGVPRGRRVTLKFSWSLPGAARQRLRNLWALHE